MDVYLGQIYAEAGASLPFSHVMQVWLGTELSRSAKASPRFQEKYGADFSVMLRVTAVTGSATTEIRGPQVFRRGREVEYTIVLPYDSIRAADDGRRTAVENLLDGVELVFERLGVKCEGLRTDRDRLANHLSTDATMLCEPWPASGGERGLG